MLIPLIAWELPRLLDVRWGVCGGIALHVQGLVTRCLAKRRSPVTNARTMSREAKDRAGDGRARRLASVATATNDDVARRAYDLYAARGRKDGHDIEDWLQAERELRGAK
jgi:hypothetical protein